MAYTTINDPTQYFNTLLYSGNGTDDRSITGVGFQPDFLWVKNRSATNGHALVDTTRGATKVLRSQTTNAEETESNGIQAFESDGFQVGTSGLVNTSSNNYVAWNWLANGGTTSSNTDGSITSTVQANTTAGFSIVTYSGNSTAGATVGHGLGKVPAMFIIKNRGQVNNWPVYHHKNTSAPETEKIQLDTTGGTADTADPYNDTAPTSSVFTLGGWDAVNSSSYTYVAYCFAEIKGYSKFGSYTGNSSSDGTFVYTGFKPAFVMIKYTGSFGADQSYATWTMFDNKRSDYNIVSLGDMLSANTSNAEGTRGGGGSGSGIDAIDMLSNGFKCRTSSYEIGQSGTYIYMAFAESPFVSSDGVPTTAR